MALFTIDIGLEEKQIKMVQDSFKYISLFIIFHILTTLSNFKNYGITGTKIFNENFLCFLLIVAITFMTYYLIILEIIEII